MRLIFAGSPEAARQCLLAIAPHHQILEVITQPAKPHGRHKTLIPTPVETAARELGLPVLATANINLETERLQALKADALIVVAFGQLLKTPLLSAFPLGGINVHFSLLPQYRGAAPVNHALLQGETVTGVSIMRMTKGLDAGPVFLKEELPIQDADTGQTLLEKLTEKGASLLRDFLVALEKNPDMQPVEQDQAAATLAPKLSKELGIILWEKSAIQVDRQIRALLPWPKARFTLPTAKGPLSVEVEKARLYPAPEDKAAPGTLLAINQEGLVVACGEGAILLEELLPSGKKMQPARAFANGHRLQPGTHLENGAV